MAAPKLGNADGESQVNKNKNGAAHLFAEIANRTSQAAGRALTFLIAAGVVLVWALGADFSLFRHLATRHQHRYDNCHLPDGLSDSELPEPGQRCHSGQA